MAKLMNKQGVLDLAKRLMDESDENVLGERYLPHLMDAWDNTENVLEEIYLEYPGLKKYIKKEETRLAGGLHDIGRPFKKSQVFHELRGARYIEEKGLGVGIVDNPLDLYRIAQMIRFHGVVSEQWAEEHHRDKRKEFEPLDSGVLIPRSWQEAIITYSELTMVQGHRVTLQEKLADFEKNYGPKGKFLKTNPDFAESLKKGLPRLIEVCESVDRLRQGKLTEPEIVQYGFL